MIAMVWQEAMRLYCGLRTGVTYIVAVLVSHLFASALLEHNDWLGACSNGRGVDRHLMGLRILAAGAGLPTPPIFADLGYTRSSNFALSTSNVSKPGAGAALPAGAALSPARRPTTLPAVAPAAAHKRPLRHRRGPPPSPPLSPSLTPSTPSPRSACSPPSNRQTRRTPTLSLSF